jgi:hypothetical protein
VIAFLTISIVGAIATAVAFRFHPSAGDVLTADGGIAGSPATTSTPHPA